MDTKAAQDRLHMEGEDLPAREAEGVLLEEAGEGQDDFLIEKPSGILFIVNLSIFMYTEEADKLA